MTVYIHNLLMFPSMCIWGMRLVG